jgi:hypothetical protein
MRERALVTDARDDPYVDDPATQHQAWPGMGNAAHFSDRDA